jgi:hypothetical protein
MYHYDPTIALEELNEDALLPHPVKLRDMIMRIKLQPQEAQAMNQEFQDYLTRFGEIQRVARAILEKLAAGNPKSA